MVNCLILGDNTKKAFPVIVTIDNTVGELRKFIKEENTRSFTSIDAKDLTLWKVDIPDEINKKTQLLNTKNPSEINIKEDLGGMELYSTTKKLGQYYSQFPADEHIHIIVQMPPPPPATGKCLLMVYLSNKGMLEFHS